MSAQQRHFSLCKSSAFMLLQRHFCSGIQGHSGSSFLPRRIMVTAVCPYWIGDTEFISVAETPDKAIKGFPLCVQGKRSRRYVFLGSCCRFSCSNSGCDMYHTQIFFKTFPGYGSSIHMGRDTKITVLLIIAIFDSKYKKIPNRYVILTATLSLLSIVPGIAASELSVLRVAAGMFAGAFILMPAYLGDRKKLWCGRYKAFYGAWYINGSERSYVLRRGLQCWGL